MNLVHAAYEPEGSGPHPTILALHGWGANALDLLGLAPHLCNGRWLVLCPQGPIAVPLGAMGTGWGWFPLTLGQPPDPAAFRAAVAAVQAFLDAAEERYPIQKNKVVLLGFSQGGVVAYALALSEPERFAGLAALSSWLPAAVVEALPARDRSQLTTLVQHGTGDDLISVSRARESLERLRSLRVPVTYREYDMGHEITGESVRDLSTWLERSVLSPIITL